MITQNPALLDAAANRLFIAGMHESASMSYIPDLATVVNTTKRTETFPHIGDGPAMELVSGLPAGEVMRRPPHLPRNSA